MAVVELRPDLKTAGGEASDMVVNGRFAGTLVLVYREGDRLSGAVQLEADHLSVREAEDARQFADRYIRDLAQALNVEEYEALVTFGSYHHIVSGQSWPSAEDERELLDEDEPEVIWVSDEDDLGDWDVYEPEIFSMDDAETGYEDDEPDADEAFYELVPTRTGAGQSEYHIYDANRDWAAELILRQTGGGLVADVHWMFSPDQQEMDALADQIVSELEEQLDDGLRLNHRYEGAILEASDYAQEDAADSAAPEAGEDFRGASGAGRDYKVVLIRDDQDMLTYDIFDRQRRVPLGTATVDISRKQLSGFIDFRDASVKSGERERIAALIMQELDKEKEYSRISFTMLARNKPIDEVVFENESYH